MHQGDITKMEDTIDILKSVLKECQTKVNDNTGNPPFNEVCDDVIILHDSLLKGVTEGLFKNEGLTVKLPSY